MIEYALKDKTGEVVSLTKLSGDLEYAIKYFAIMKSLKTDALLKIFSVERVS